MFSLSAVERAKEIYADKIHEVISDTSDILEVIKF